MKATRQRAILSLISTRPIHSQEELAHLLERAGHEVTQATVSRDIRELGLVKVPLRDGSPNGAFKYVEPGLGPAYASRLHRMVAELVTQIKGSENLIVLHTPPGSAMMVASAIDGAGWGEIIGTIGGDDTILIILSSAKKRPVVQQRFEDMRAAEQSA
jgi:transcriptional regulator of arginine metabolism